MRLSVKILTMEKMRSYIRPGNQWFENNDGDFPGISYGGSFFFSEKLNAALPENRVIIVEYEKNSTTGIWRDGDDKYFIAPWMIETMYCRE